MSPSHVSVSVLSSCSYFLLNTVPLFHRSFVHRSRSTIMRTQLSFNFLTISLFATFSFAEHIPPQNILWGERGPAGATLLPVTKTSPKPDLIEERDTQCTNSHTFRNCWFGGYSVATDFDAKWPTTGKTVHVSALPQLFFGPQHN